MPHRELRTVVCKRMLLQFCQSAYVALVIISIIIVVAYQRSAVLSIFLKTESSQFMGDAEKVLPNLTNHPTKHLKSPISAESSQLMRQTMTNKPNKHSKSPRPAESNQFRRESETAWVKVGSEMFVFSAYMDTRENYYYSKRGVVALAVQNDRMNHPFLYCHLTDSNGHTWCLKRQIRKVVVNHCRKYKYRPYYYICDLPPRFSAITPKFVSFSFNSSCQQPSPPVPVTQVQNTTNSTQGFGVCIQSPLFNMNNVQFIIQTIEMNRILGAERFTFYIHSASQDVMRVLQDYSKEGVVDVVKSTIPNINIHYYGQQVLIQDCAYRNMYKIRHLLYTDLDEIIVPQNHQNWSQMITAIDRKSIGSFHVRHVTLVGKKTSQKTISICNSSKEIEIPRFMKFTERSSPYRLPRRAKYIIKPETFAVAKTHDPGQLLEGYSIIILCSI